jgi:hypothetical protein
MYPAISVDRRNLLKSAIERWFIRLALAVGPVVFTAPGQMSVTAAGTPDANPPRVAVISDPENANLAALVTVELSANPAVSLVERNELARVGDEMKLQQLAGSDAVSLGKLIGADGLIFIGKGANGVQVRFTAVGLGYALFDDQIAEGADPEGLAKAVAHRVAGYAPKLRLDATKAVPISILNLRAEIVSTGYDTTERKLTLLLESRLSAMPTYVVLERRHAWDLAFDRGLNASGAQLLKGSYIVDGLIRNSGANGEAIEVDLRLRKPQSTEVTTLQAQGRSDDLPALADAMAGQIAKSIGLSVSKPGPQSQTEAREYLQEGLWGLKHNEQTQALEALDSAALLGGTSIELYTARIAVLCQMSAHPRWVTPLPLEERLALVRRAIADLKAGGKGQDTVVTQAVGVLEDIEKTQDDQKAYAFRQEVRALANFDPLHGKAPDSQCFHGEDLSNSSEEEMAFYHMLCSTQVHTVPLLNPDEFCLRFLKTQEARRAAYDQFVQGLLSDPKGKLFGLAMQSMDPDPAVRDKAYPQFLDEFWNQRDELIQTGKINSYLWEAVRIPEDVREKYMKQSIPLLYYLLAQPRRYRNIMEFLWKPEWFPAEDADAIWSHFKQEEYKKSGGFPPGDTKYIKSFLAVFPGRETTMPDPDKDKPRLMVDKFWAPPTGGGRMLTEFTISPDGKGIQFVTISSDNHMIMYHVSIPDFATEEICPDLINFRMVATPDAYYFWSQDKMKRYDRATHAWSIHQLSEYPMGVYYCRL